MCESHSLPTAARERSFSATPEVAPLFAGNFELLREALHDGTTARVCAADGGYFLVAEAPDGASDVDFCRRLAEAKGVVCTPMSVFYASEWPETAPCNLVRFTVCKSREYIAKACEALRAGDRV